MTDFVTVAIVLFLFLCFGIAMGVLMVSALSRRKARGYLEGDGDYLEGDDDPRPPLGPPAPPEGDPPWYDR
jgi:hypothetical protein